MPQNVDVCLFPIPDCVTFPGTVFPLHVFEPRYREMVTRCVEEGIPLAICHTQSKISDGKSTDNLKDALSSNQATYKTFQVISAGSCDLYEITDDGRIYANVHLNQRYRLVEQVQLLPYQVYRCEVFDDASENDEELNDNQQLKEKIINRLKVLGHQDEKLQEILMSSDWQTKEPQKFSFEIFGLIRFDADILQDILEMDTANQRLSHTLTLLNQV